MTKAHSNHRLEVGISPSGEPITVVVKRVDGARPGKTLALLSGVHGDEGLGPLALNTFLAELDHEELSGTIVAVPVCNPPAFGTRTRSNVWDGGDLIRLWPGKPDGTITEHVADAIFEGVIRGADAVVDLHSGTPVLNEYWCIYGNSHGPGGGVDTEIEMRSRDLAVAFGLDQVIRAHPWFGTQMAAARAGIPAIITEIGGGSDFHQNGDHYLHVITRGIRNVLVHLGMLEGELVADTAACEVFDIVEDFVSRTTGGYWRPSVRPGDALEAGALVGCFVDPQTGNVVSDLRAAEAGDVLNPTADWPHVGIGQWLMCTGRKVDEVERASTVKIVGRIGHDRLRHK